MTSPIRWFITTATTALAVGLLGAPSSAELTRDECVDVNAKAQELRREGKLGAARAELRRCAEASCPKLVRDDCTRRLDDAERAQPTIVFEVKDALGSDVIDVRASLDGEPWADRLDGRAKPVDPGAHEFRFDAQGHRPVTARFLVREGEIGRRERVVMPATLSKDALPTSPASSSPSQTVPPIVEAVRSGYRIPVAVSLAAAGLVGIGVGTAFGLMALSAKGDAVAACGGDLGRCSDVVNGNANKSTAETDGTVSTVAFAAGGLLAAAGAVLFFSRSDLQRNTSTMMLTPHAGPSQVGVTWRGLLP